jgi:hypothetical protein
MKSDSNGAGVRAKNPLKRIGRKLKVFGKAVGLVVAAIGLIAALLAIWDHFYPNPLFGTLAETMSKALNEMQTIEAKLANRSTPAATPSLLTSPTPVSSDFALMQASSSKGMPFQMEHERFVTIPQNSPNFVNIRFRITSLRNDVKAFAPMSQSSILIDGWSLSSRLGQQCRVYSLRLIDIPSYRPASSERDSYHDNLIRLLMLSAQHTFESSVRAECNGNVSLQDTFSFNAALAVIPASIDSPDDRNVSVVSFSSGMADIPVR